MTDTPTLAIKQTLADAIVAIAKQTNFYVAAWGLGLDPARLSDLRAGRLDRFTIDRLVRVLATVGRRVDVSIAVEGDERVRWFHEALHAQRERQQQQRAARRRPNRDG